MAAERAAVAVASTATTEAGVAEGAVGAAGSHPGGWAGSRAAVARGRVEPQETMAMEGAEAEVPTSAGRAVMAREVAPSAGVTVRKAVATTAEKAAPRVAVVRAVAPTAVVVKAAAAPAVVTAAATVGMWGATVAKPGAASVGRSPWAFRQ